MQIKHCMNDTTVKVFLQILIRCYNRKSFTPRTIHAITHDFTACEIINVTLFYNSFTKYTIKMMEGLCEPRRKKKPCFSIQ